LSNTSPSAVGNALCVSSMVAFLGTIVSLSIAPYLARGKIVKVLFGFSSC
jgi:hypothetical protein